MTGLTQEPILIDHLIKSVKLPNCGAIDLFIGTVRNNTNGREVKQLEFEAYEKMALKEMDNIVKDALIKWPIGRVNIIHRLGTLKIGEIAVAIAVSSPHRAAAFEACRYVIDTLKKTVPIWKKEVFQDGDVWVSAYP